jgi:FkbM family methyltransferase
MANLIYQLKQAVNSGLRRFGYRIEKLVDVDGASIDTFALAIAALGPTRPDFFFVQVGAHNGKDDDPIRPYVLRHHWRGVLVEPHPAMFAELRANYAAEPQLRFENAAVGDADGTAVLHVPRKASGAQSVNLASFDRDVLARRVGASTPIDAITVPSLTINSLLAKHGVGDIALLQIDTEGYDFEILKRFDFATRKPSLIRYEHINLSRADREASLEFLRGHGYSLARDQIDTIALRLPGLDPTASAAS